MHKKEAFLVFLLRGQLESTDLSKSISPLLYFSTLDEKLHSSPVQKILLSSFSRSSSLETELKERLKCV